jgi:glutathione S-transferase
MSAPKDCVTLTYFRGRGLGERPRWCLAAANVPFENIILTKREEMLDLINNGELQFNQLPLLQFPDQPNLKLVQSRSICRYIAKTYGLDGETMEEQTKCDMLAEYTLDFGGIIGYPFKSPDQKESFKNDMKELFDKKAPMLENALNQGFSLFLLNNSSSTSAAAENNKVRYSDIFVAEAMSWYIEIYGNEILNNYPKINELTNKVMNLPQIKEYLSSSKRFPFPDGEVGEQYVANVNEVLGR